MSAADVNKLRDVLRGEVRIELSFAFGIKGTYPCAVLYVRGENARWRKADLPMILPPEDGDRADLLHLLADLCKKEGE